MKLYTAKLSPFAAKVRIALDEKGLSCEEIALPALRTGLAEKPAELLAANPRGQVPVLIDDDVALYDSTVILEYLEDTHPEPALYPREPAARARARLYEDFGDWMLGGCVSDLLAETYRKPDATTRDAEAIEAATGDVARAYDRLEAELAQRDYLGGDAFGAADVSCTVATAIAAAYGAPPGQAHPRLRAWLERVSKRPSVVREMASMTEAVGELPN